MLTQELTTELIKVANSLDALFSDGCFSPISNAIRIWNNYTINFIAEYNIGNISEIAAAIANNKEIKHQSERIVVAKLDYSGYYLFPQNPELEEQRITQNQIVLEEFKERLKELFEDAINELERDEFDKFIEGQKNKLEKMEKIIKDKKLTLPLPSQSMTPSLFYYINEMVAKIFSGGIWEDATASRIMYEEALYNPEYDDEPTIPFYIYWKTIFKTTNTNIHFFIETSLDSEFNSLKETIVKIGNSEIKIGRAHV